MSQRMGKLISLFISAFAAGCGWIPKANTPSHDDAGEVPNPPTANPQLPLALALDDAPDCRALLDRVKIGAPLSSLKECWRRLFLPLHSAPLPFPSTDLAAAGINHFAVAPGWTLTALHTWSGSCFLENFLYVTSPVELPGCGTALIVGGHPHLRRCQENGTRIGTCVDQVPLEEAFDIGLFSEPTGSTFLPLAPSVPKMGDRVYIIGNPLLVQHHIPEYANTPLVSYGKVRSVQGRAMVISNLAHQGNSGGPILNEAGQVVGLVYTGVRMLRGQGVAVNEDFQDWDTVGMVVDERIRLAVASLLP